MANVDKVQELLRLQRVSKYRGEEKFCKIHSEKKENFINEIGRGWQESKELLKVDLWP